MGLTMAFIHEAPRMQCPRDTTFHFALVLKTSLHSMHMLILAYLTCNVLTKPSVVFNCAAQ